jgi:translation initiation factor 3 subunit L
MSVRQAPTYQQGAPERPLDDDSDVEEEALANDYREQVGYEDGQGYDLDRSVSLGGGPQDLQAQLQAAATPLEYQATLETKIQSYDSYCNLFHFILNSEGPVDIEVPNYYWAWDVIDEFIYQFNSFCAYRQRLAYQQSTTSANEDEINVLRENPNTWGCYSVRERFGCAGVLWDEG